MVRHMTMLEIAALLAATVLAWLLYLLLFERGASYGTSEPVHQLSDAERLRVLTSLLATPAQSIDSLEIIREGPGLYEAQLIAIRGATRSVHLECYIFYPGSCAEAILEALCERARAGNAVRVIIDAIGSLRTPASYFAPLIAAGGRVYRYHPLHWHLLLRWNSRTHRNLLIVDGKVGFIGGAGVADHWRGGNPSPWRDFVALIAGPVVAGLQAVFAENWLECSGEALVGEDTFPVENPAAESGPFATGIAVGSTPTAGRSTRARVLVQFMLATARESIELCSPYFIPDLGIRRELLAARARGVRVRILAGGPYSDHGLVRRAGRRRYGSLLRAGVEVSEYASHMMHAKVLVIDGRWSLLGSTNIDHRSFDLNDEVNLLVRSRELASQLQQTFEDDLSSSVPVNLTAWNNRPLGERVLATLGRVIERHQ